VNAEQVARRTTADGVGVVLWSDGAVSGRLGCKLPGVPVAAPRTDEGRRLALAAGWLFMGEVEIYDLDETPALYSACRWAAERNGLPGDVRARMAALAAPAVRPSWEVVRTDRDGRPTTRVWRLPRVRWPGLAVWDHVSVGASGGRYELMAVDRQDVCTPTGLRFSRLADLAAHLHTEAVA
jgi:hypothetical protein